MRLKLVPNETSVDFLRLRGVASIFSATIVAASILLFAFVGLNLGIDFKGGILMEARTSQAQADISELRSDLDELGLGDISIQGLVSKPMF